MSLIYCPECKNVVSEFAQACPMCGFPINNSHVLSKGQIEALFQKGEDLLLGKHDWPKYHDAFGYLVRAAEAGHPAAQRYIGKYYDYGICPVEQDLREATKWYKKAAAQGDSEAIEWMENDYLYYKAAGLV